MDNIVSFPEHLTEKGRALAGLSPADRDSLLAASAALGIKHDNDPFWIIQGTFTQVKTLVVEMRAMAAQTAADSKEAMEAAEATLAEARAVAKQIAPTHESALAHIQATVKGAQAVLVEAAAGRIADAAADEIHAQVKSTGLPYAQIAGFTAASLNLTTVFAIGDLMGVHGWNLTAVPYWLSVVGVPGVLVGQALVVPSIVFFLYRNR